MTRDFVLPQSDVQFKTTFGHIRHQLLGNVVPMRLLDDSHKEIASTGQTVKNEY